MVRHSNTPTYASMPAPKRCRNYKTWEGRWKVRPIYIPSPFSLLCVCVCVNTIPFLNSFPSSLKKLITNLVIV